MFGEWFDTCILLEKDHLAIMGVVARIVYI
jgi:hypothetical protein